MHALGVQRVNRLLQSTIFAKLLQYMWKNDSQYIYSCQYCQNDALFRTALSAFFIALAQMSRKINEIIFQHMLSALSINATRLP